MQSTAVSVDSRHGQCQSDDDAHEISRHGWEVCGDRQTISSFFKAMSTHHFDTARVDGTVSNRVDLAWELSRESNRRCHHDLAATVPPAGTQARFNVFNRIDATNAGGHSARARNQFGLLGISFNYSNHSMAPILP